MRGMLSGSMLEIESRSSGRNGASSSEITGSILMGGMGMVVITVVGAVMLSVARRPVRAGRERRRRLSRGLVEREVLPFLFFSLLVTIFTHDKLTYAGSEVSGKTVSPPLAHS